MAALGAFPPAHQAASLQDLHERGDKRWSIVAANIRPDPLDPGPAMRAQGCAYTLETVTPEGMRAYRRIRAISAVLDWEPEQAAVVAAGADPAPRIVSSTVTEAGYFLGADGRLDLDARELLDSLAASRCGRAGATIYSVLRRILRAA